MADDKTIKFSENRKASETSDQPPTLLERLEAELRAVHAKFNQPGPRTDEICQAICDRRWEICELAEQTQAHDARSLAVKLRILLAQLDLDMDVACHVPGSVRSLAPAIAGDVAYLAEPHEFAARTNQ